MPTVADSISEAVKRRTAPFVDASIHAWPRSQLGNETEQQNTYPWNEALVEPCNTTATPNGLHSLEHGLRPVGCHLRLEHLKGLTKSRNLHFLSELTRLQDVARYVDSPPAGIQSVTPPVS